MSYPGLSGAAVSESWNGNCGDQVFLRRVGNRIEERFGSFAPDHIFFGGNRLILNPLIHESKYLQTKADKISPRILPVRYADREALAGSLAEINKSLVFSF